MPELRMAASVIPEGILILRATSAPPTSYVTREDNLLPLLERRPSMSAAHVKLDTDGKRVRWLFDGSGDESAILYNHESRMR